MAMHKSYFKNNHLVTVTRGYVSVVRPWVGHQGAWRKRRGKGCQWVGQRLSTLPELEEGFGYPQAYYYKDIPEKYILRSRDFEPDRRPWADLPADMPHNSKIKIIRYYALLRRQWCFEMFRREVPAHIRTLLVELSCNRWNLLVLFKRVEGAVELFRSTPALAFAMAHIKEFRPDLSAHHLTFARRYIGRRQIDIAAFLKFPRQKMVINILRKIQISTLDISQLKIIRDMLLNKPQNIKILLHIKQITPNLLDIIIAGLPHAIISRLAFNKNMHLSNEETCSILSLYKDTCRMYRQLYQPAGDQLTGITRIQSYRRLREYHDELAALQLKREVKDIKGTLPGPPIEPQGPITHVGTLPELFQTAKQEFFNCIYSYRLQILLRQYSVFKYTDPASDIKCCIGLSIDTTGAIELAEARLPYNKAAPEAVLTHINHWVRTAPRRTSFKPPDPEIERPEYANLFIVPVGDDLVF